LVDAWQWFANDMNSIRNECLGSTVLKKGSDSSGIKLSTCQMRPSENQQQTNKQASKQANKQASKQTSKQTNKQTNKQANKQTSKRCVSPSGL